jgi:hypothetical protein
MQKPVAAFVLARCELSAFRLVIASHCWQHPWTTDVD